MHGLFPGLTEADKADFIRRGRRRRYRAGDKVFWQGDAGDSVHLVTKGSFAASVSTPVADAMIVAVFWPDDVFGELGVLGATNRRNATVIALEPSSTLSMDKTAFEQWRAARPHVDQLLIRALADRVQEMTDQMLEIVSLPVHRRIARRLLLMDAATGQADPGRWIQIRQEELAAFCGASRPAVNRALRQLAVEEIVELSRGRVRVVDCDGLRRTAGRS